MIKSESIDHLKSKINIVDVISDHLKLIKKGSEYVSLCPFHNEKTPSFSVSQSKQIYKCFGCGKSGDAISFIMDYESKNFVDSIKYLSDRFNINIEFEENKKKYNKPIPRLEKINFNWIDYFKIKRSISNNTLLKFGISQSIEWMPKAQKEINVICFNYYKNGELINIKFRGPNKDFKLNKDSELIFYNLDSIKDYDTVIITEGEIDCMTLYECGFHNVISVPNGASLNGPGKLEYLNNCWEYFENKKEIILCTDSDVPGYNLREELARRLGKDKCKKITLKNDCKDINEVLVKYGKDSVIEIINSAIEYPIEGIHSMEDMFEDVVNFYENGYPNGIKLGINEFDEFIQFMPGQFTTITGIPGSGKSEFTDMMMVKSAINHYWNWAVISFENQPSSIHVTKLMEKVVDKSFSFRKDIDKRMNEEEFKYAIYNIDKYFNFININTNDVTLDGILNKCRELVLRKGIKGILIDPWNYIEHKIQNGITETQYISECLTKIKSFCIANGVHIFLIAHPRKMGKDDKGNYNIPTLYDIAGSAHFFNKTDNGICVYRNFDDNLVDIYIQKIRYGWLGKVGSCSFKYDTEIRKYINIDK